MNTVSVRICMRLESTSTVRLLQRFRVSSVRSCFSSVKCAVACGPLAENGPQMRLVFPDGVENCVRRTNVPLQYITVDCIRQQGCGRWSKVFLWKLLRYVCLCFFVPVLLHYFQFLTQLTDFHETTGNEPLNCCSPQ